MASGSDSRAGGAPARTRARPIGRGQLPSRAFAAGRQVRFGDCDPAGIVYTPRFVDRLCCAVEDFFLAQGLDYHGLIRGGLGLGYARVECEFFRPGFMGDDLTYTVIVERIGCASAEFTIHAHRDQDEVMRGNLVMVATSLATHRAEPLPPAMRSILTTYQDLCR
ncbi:MAG: thioesterase family protein [Hyphomonadaceae bacterium]|nr:thioesterase family protein [Hyphomonadaceae bacterium]